MVLQQTLHWDLRVNVCIEDFFFLVSIRNWKKERQRTMCVGLLECVSCFMSMNEVGMVKLNCSFPLFHNLFHLLQSVLSTFVHFENRWQLRKANSV